MKAVIVLWITILVFNLPCLAFLGGALYLMAHDKSGWGWLLLLSGLSCHVKTDKKEAA